MSLTEAEKRQLRRLAHDLHPLVQTGARGLTESVLSEIDRTLHDHELVKVRVLAESRPDRKAMIERICTHCDAQLVQRVGHVAVLFRRNPEKPRIQFSAGN